MSDVNVYKKEFLHDEGTSFSKEHSGLIIGWISDTKKEFPFSPKYYNKFCNHIIDEISNIDVTHDEQIIALLGAGAFLKRQCSILRSKSKIRSPSKTEECRTMPPLTPVISRPAPIQTDLNTPASPGGTQNLRSPIKAASIFLQLFKK